MTTLEFGYELTGMQQSLLPFAFKLTKNQEEANDLLQETLYKAFSNKEKFKEGTNLKAWLFTIMKNTFITNYQKLIRKNTFIDTTDNLHFINSSKNTTENLAYSNFTNEDINHALDKLSDTYKTPFIMYFKGFKYHEIAIKLNIPIGTVKNRIHIARKELKYFLKTYTFSN